MPSASPSARRRNRATKQRVALDDVRAQTRFPLPDVRPRNIVKPASSALLSVVDLTSGEARSFVCHSSGEAVRACSTIPLDEQDPQLLLQQLGDLLVHRGCDHTPPTVGCLAVAPPFDFALGVATHNDGDLACLAGWSVAESLSALTSMFVVVRNREVAVALAARRLSAPECETFVCLALAPDLSVTILEGEHLAREADGALFFGGQGSLNPNVVSVDEIHQWMPHVPGPWHFPGPYCQWLEAQHTASSTDTFAATYAELIATLCGSFRPSAMAVVLDAQSSVQCAAVQDLLDQAATRLRLDLARGAVFADEHLVAVGCSLLLAHEMPRASDDD